MAITVGSAAIDRAAQFSVANMTYLWKDNPATGSGVITDIDIWMNQNATGVMVGFFYEDGGSGKYTCRSYVDIGDVTAGSKYTKSGQLLAVEAGDLIGIHADTGMIECTASGGQGYWSAGGDQMECAQQTFASGIDLMASLYATGVVIHNGECAIGASTSLAAGGYTIRPGVATIAASASMTASPTRKRPGAASLLSVVSLAIAGKIWTSASVTIQAVPSLACAATRTASGVAAITANSAVEAIAHKIATGQVSIQAVPSMVADCIGKQYGEVAIQAVSSLSARANYIVNSATCEITAVSALEIVGLAYVAKALGYTGTLTAGDVLVIDTDKMTVKLNGADARADFTGEFWKLFSGTNQLKWESDETPTATLKVDHEPRWL